MTESTFAPTTRRDFLRRVVLGGAALTTLALLQACSGSTPTPTPAPQAAPSGKPGSGPDPALLEASKKEGKLVWYSPVVEEDKVKHLATFKGKYPWVDVSEYLRLQTGKLYAKIEPEMQQNVQSCDILTLSEIALVLDFQKKGYWMSYASADMDRYDAKWKSNPVGLWTTGWINIAGIAWNPNNVKAADAPKSYQDLLDPKWANSQIGFKDSASGLQYAQYAMIAKLYGEGWWDRMIPQKPIGLAGTAQQYEKVLNGEIKINGLAQTSTYVQQKQAGAPIEILLPKEGVPFTGLTTGIVKNAPHAATAKLFIDWLIGEEGAKAITSVSADPVTMKNGPAPALTPKPEELNVWVPEDMETYIAAQPAWREKWNKITGV
jgi:iron(III) transport system substrate-binding protein